jgi:hypothetical protein
MFSSNTNILRGQEVADVLAGAWRDSPTVSNLSTVKFEQITPLLLNSGAAALLWRQIEQSANLRQSSFFLPYREAYRYQAIHGIAREHEIAHIFKLFRAAEVEPVLIKGWAIARHYPASSLRPQGDIDLCVRSEQYQTAQKILENTDARRYHIDLHQGFVKLDIENVNDLYARSELIKICEIEARVLSAEDHLRLLCSHALGHGACRALWLCDIAVAVEKRPKNFDWQICFSDNPVRANWVACAVLLAHELLGLSIDDTPVREVLKRLPDWTVQTVLRQWGVLTESHGVRKPFAAYMHNPKGVIKALQMRYPNRIEATISSRRAFDESSGLPLQMANIFWRAAEFLTETAKRRRKKL